MSESSYPILCDNKLSPEDFERFSGQFSRILLSLVPTATRCIFYFYTPFTKNKNLSAQHNQIFSDLIENETQTYLFEQKIYFSYQIGHLYVVAEVSEIEPIVYGKIGADWLDEVWFKGRRKWQRIRERYVDISTNLLNQHSLDIALYKKSGLEYGLLLIDIPQNSPNSLAFLKGLSSSIQLLHSSFLQPDQLFYFGASIFAVLLPVTQTLASYGEDLLDFFRKNGISKAHIGMCHLRQGGAPISSSLTALEEATTRGPYGFCDYATIIAGDKHPLAEAPLFLELEMIQQISKYKKFSVLLFENISSENLFPVLPVLEALPTYVHAQKCYVLLKDFSSQEAYDFATSVVAEYVASGVELHVGMSTYPLQGTAKKHALSQARKALIHTKFYGPNSVTAFDGTSLNVSGDIFYGEGHYVKAAKEYRFGCILEPKNINILNSMGVSLAMMGKREAVEYFNRALTLDSKNFMALYNKGLFHFVEKENALAIEIFQKARSLMGDDAHAFKEDLSLRLGILYAEAGAPQKSLDLLLPYVEKHKQEKVHLAYLIGKCFFETSAYKSAILWLQKAHMYKTTEAEIYSLLGYLYYKTGEGKSSISLTRKAVALAPHNGVYVMRLAEVLFGNGFFMEAKELTQKCLRKKHTKERARILLSEIYEAMGEKSKSRRLMKV